MIFIEEVIFCQLGFLEEFSPDREFDRGIHPNDNEAELAECKCWYGVVVPVF